MVINEKDEIDTIRNQIKYLKYFDKVIIPSVKNYFIENIRDYRLRYPDRFSYYKEES